MYRFAFEANSPVVGSNCRGVHTENPSWMDAHRAASAATLARQSLEDAAACNSNIQEWSKFFREKLPCLSGVHEGHDSKGAGALYDQVGLSGLAPIVQGIENDVAQEVSMNDVARLGTAMGQELAVGNDVGHPSFPLSSVSLSGNNVDQPSCPQALSSVSLSIGFNDSLCARALTS